MSDSKTVKLNVDRDEKTELDSATVIFCKKYGDGNAILYSPKECFLAKVKVNKFEYIDKNGDLKSVELSNVYEARIFNKTAELRWLKTEEKGIAVTLSETEVNEEFGGDVLLKNSQQYLLWGEVSPTNESENNGEWTELAEARIGKFYVPIKTTSRACFEATEYLKSYENQDGNVAVFEERLTGIKPYSTETKGEKENA